MTLIELEYKVVEWANTRGLIKEGDPYVQFAKVIEETGELAESMVKDKPDQFKDSIGDVLVTLIILARQKGTNIQHCLEIAYNEIKDRSGRTMNGGFIKQEDLNV